MADALYFDNDYVNDGYAIEGIEVNWGTGEIFVPRESMELVQTNPTEIRRLDSNDFRLALKDLEDSPTGMPYTDTHRHNTTVLLGGIEYARIIEILEPYTITFEDGRYAVQISGSNNNIGDRVNVNNVSVRSANSAGLIQTREIEYNTFAGGVTIDQTNGVSGQAYPTGTPIRPVNNVADARFIAQSRGFSTFYIKGDLTLDSGDDVSAFLLVGDNATRSYITINSPSDTAAVEIRNCTVTGVLDGGTIIRDSYVFDLAYVNGFLFNCELAGTITLGGGFPAHIMSCFAAINQTEIDMGGSGNGLNMQQCSGDFLLTNKTGTDTCGIHITSGRVVLGSTVTNTTGIHLAGVGGLANNSGQPVPINNMVSVDAIFDRAQTTPIYSNVKQVNSVAIKGTGQLGNEWQPDL
jgi:hypothetical protein